MNPSSMWAIEYSHSQETFHIGKTSEMLRRNVNSVYVGEQTDYICVGIFATREQAADAMLEFRRKRLSSYTMALMI